MTDALVFPELRKHFGEASRAYDEALSAYRDALNDEAEELPRECLRRWSWEDISAARVVITTPGGLSVTLARGGGLYCSDKLTGFPMDMFGPMQRELAKAQAREEAELAEQAAQDLREAARELASVTASQAFPAPNVVLVSPATAAKLQAASEALREGDGEELERLAEEAVEAVTSKLAEEDESADS